MKTTKFYAIPDENGIATYPLTTDRLASGDRPYAVVPWSEYMKMGEVVRWARLQKCDGFSRNNYCGKCPSCIARKLAKGKRK